MRVAIVGSRSCESLKADAIFRYLPEGCSGIISGGAKGVDSFAEAVAEQLGIPFERIVPDYKKNGKKAPLLRNEAIVRRADMVLAFWDFQSRGTAHTIIQCIEQGVPVRVIGLDEVSIHGLG